MIERSAEMKSRYPACSRLLSGEAWNKTLEEYGRDGGDSGFADFMGRAEGLPHFIGDLARVEEARSESSRYVAAGYEPADRIVLNPSLKLLSLSWRGIPNLLNAEGSGTPEPEPGEDIVIVWRDPDNGDVMTRSATDSDLLALKLVVEDIPAERAASSGIPVGALDAALNRAAGDGLLLKPPSRIKRRPDEFPVTEGMDREFLVAESFTLQWHITQSCDLHCRHCYDRTARERVSLERGVAVLEDMRRFCRERFVRGHVTFSGGNPLMHPDFLELYRAAADMGMGLGILGNPTTHNKLDAIMEIAEPSYFQVSLEGLEDHNDYIRGKGHFRRTLDFLDMLNEAGMYSMVMLTLTSGNIDQVIPLAEMLEGRTGSFNFNRLSPVGEGAGLALPDRAGYARFLEEYLDAREKHPHMRLKDNLFNTALDERGMPPFDGCTGFGCGAAFNFVSVLADGEVHACRKFPSPIGNLYRRSISEIYDSEQAKRYRRGASGCSGCRMRASCGGCMSMAYGAGLDPFVDTDPYCMKKDK